MKILIVTTKPPSSESATPVRNKYLLSALRQIADVTYVCITDEYSSVQQSVFKKNIYGNTIFISVPKLNIIKKFIYLLHRKIPYLERLRNNPNISNIPYKNIYDYIHLEELDAFYAVERLLPMLKGKLVLDAHNVDFIRFSDSYKQYSLINKIADIVYLPIFKKMEVSALRKVTHILACSEEDKRIFSKFVNKEKITVIPNGVDTSFFRPNYKNYTPKTIIFMGLLSYPPNEDALTFYISSVHKQVLRKFSDYRLLIIGKGLTAKIKRLIDKSENISYQGFVSDVREYIGKSEVCICPIKQGSGTRLKILEYMAMGKPVVSTTKGCEGLEVQKDNNILIADTAQEFAESIITLLSNSHKAKEIGLNGRKLVVEKYDWEKIGKKLEYI